MSGWLPVREREGEQAAKDKADYGGNNSK